MKALCFALLIPLFSIKQTTAQQDVCPPWFIPDNTSSTGCSCQGLDEVIKCGLDFPLLHLGFCMTYNSTTEATAFGPCPYIAQYISFVNYIQLPENVSLLNEFMCGPLNREKVSCVESVKIAMALHYTHTLWNAVSAGDMVMDGPCTFSWNCSQ